MSRWPGGRSATSVVVAVLASIGLASCSVGPRQGLTPDQGAAPTARSLLVIGDSYAAGAGATSPTDSFAWGAGRLLGARTTVDAVNGTGFVNPGYSGVDERYTTRLDALPDAALDVDVVVVEGGLNDRSASPGEIRAAAEDLLRTLRERADEAQIVVMGATAPQPGSPQASVAVNDALASAAATTGTPFLDPVAQRWFTEENEAEYVAADGLHPTQAGHDHLARLLADDIAALLRD